MLVKLGAETDVDEGSGVSLAFDPGDAHLFDPETGARVRVEPQSRAA